MRALTYTTAKGGLNRQRIKGGTKAETLYDALNCYQSGAKTWVQRDGTIRDTLLGANTIGLTAFQDILHVFTTAVDDYTPVGYLANVLAHPDQDSDATLDKIHFAEPFMGALYVVAEWSDGGIYHYWLASSGEWAAETVYLNGDVVTPTVPNGLLYKALPNNPDAPTQTWQALHNYAIGDKVLPTVANGYYYEVTATQGDVPTSGAAEPDWIASEGAEVTESTDSSGAPAASSQVEAGPQVPPDVQDRYGTGNTALSDSSSAAAAVTDNVATWTPGTLYNPGALVRPSSAAPAVNSAIPNAGFESGDTGWTKGTGWHITNVTGSGKAENPYQGAWYAYWDESEVSDLSYHYLEMTTTVPVVPGQFLSASCYESRNGGNNSGMTDSLVLLWYDAYDVLVKETVGTTSNANNSHSYRVFTVQDTTPGGATKVRVAHKAKASSLLPGQQGRAAVDSFTWDYVNLTPAEADFTTYQAVQAAAGTSGTSEPVWPGPGNTVVDNEVTWLGGVTSVITWTAVPIMKSGTTEPDWVEQPGSSTPDGTISWQATTGYVEEAPNSKVVALAAKKVFAADDDIVRYSATVNPLDWTTAEDAGYLPVGLNTHGSNPTKVLALYRSNLIAFNSAGFQMWQVDPDPQLMSLQDAVPIGSTYHKAAQPVKNDLIFLCQLGARSIGIAGASTNLEGGDVGDPVDPLVAAELVAGTYEPFSIYYPARGQYWLIFGPQAFVLTLNDFGPSWSRYVFPEALTYATLLDNDLYLRTVTNKVWKVDAATLVDDYSDVDGDPAALLLHFDEDEAYNPAVPEDSNIEGYANVISVNLDGSSSQGTVTKFDYAYQNTHTGNGRQVNVTPDFDLTAEPTWSMDFWAYIAADINVNRAILVGSVSGEGYSGLSAEIDGAFENYTLYFNDANGVEIPETGVTFPLGEMVHVALQLTEGTLYLFQNGVVVGSVAAASVNWQPTFGLLPTFNNGFTSVMDEFRITLEAPFDIAGFTPPTAPYDPNPSHTGTEFEGVLWWPALDNGSLGQNKQLDSFDLVCTGEVAVQFGYDQRDPTVLTDDYTLAGDTLPGTSIPFPLSGPSFAPKLTFSGNQAWEWMALNLYLQDSRGSGFAG